MQVRNLRERLEEERMGVRLREAEAAALQARLHRLLHVLVGTSRALAAGPAAPGAAVRLQRTSSQGSIEVRAMHAACMKLWLRCRVPTWGSKTEHQWY